MLLIDKHGRIRSIVARNVRVPFVRERLRYNEAGARTLFADRRSDLGFIQALREELERCRGSLPLSLPYPAGLIDAGMWAIADGMIDVASVLPDGVAVTFDEDRPSEWYKSGMVVFAGPAVSDDFVSGILKTPANQRALEAALEHPAGRRHSVVPPMRDAPRHFSRPADAPAAPALRVGWLLATRLLALVPRDPSRRQLRLVWVDHHVAVAGDTSPPAAGPPPRNVSAPAPASSSNAPASVLPDAPDDVSPQAQTLIDAAEDGTPFCEECARRAAELANA
ncbi:MAG TPA: hypothetical protein VND19_04755 [Acetobacteraceae bacterium]|nr:hypothetical protein [Acetobacteraceae bacterium]